MLEYFILIEFKSVVSDVDVIVSEPYIFENSTTAPVLFSSDLSLKFLQLSFAGCEPFMKAVEERKQVHANIMLYYLTAH